MKNFKDPDTGVIYQYELDGSQDAFIKPGLVEVSDFEAKSCVEAIQAIREASPEFINNKRLALLSESDWTILPDSPLTTVQKTAWTKYRQALRDITTQNGYPTTVTWPVKP